MVVEQGSDRDGVHMLGNGGKAADIREHHRELACFGPNMVVASLHQAEDELLGHVDLEPVPRVGRGVERAGGARQLAYATVGDPRLTAALDRKEVGEGTR